MITTGVVIDDKFEIQEFIGSGGFADIYAVRQNGLDRRCALKLLHDACMDDDTLGRFKREARILCSLNHPNIAGFYSFGTWRNQPYLVMEFADGPSLQSAMAARNFAPLSVSEVLHIAVQICAGLKHAHAAGIIHRDLSASNVILVNEFESSVVKLIDFGLAKFNSDASRNIVQTDVGQALGSVLFMSPEQCVGHPADARSDIYSLGCIMYFCLTGTFPFEADSNIATMYKQVSAPAPELISEDKTTQVLAKVVSQCLQKQPSDRYESTSVLENVLLNIQSEVEKRGAQPFAETPPLVRRTEAGDTAQRARRHRLSRAGSSCAILAISVACMSMAWFAFGVRHQEGTGSASRSLTVLSQFARSYDSHSPKQQNQDLATLRALLPLPPMPDGDLDTGKKLEFAGTRLFYAKHYEQALPFLAEAEKIFAEKHDDSLLSGVAAQEVRCLFRLRRVDDALNLAARYAPLLTQPSGDSALTLSIATNLLTHSVYSLTQRYLEGVLHQHCDAKTYQGALVTYCSLIEEAGTAQRLAAIDRVRAQAAALQAASVNASCSAAALATLAAASASNPNGWHSYLETCLKSIPAAAPDRAMQMFATAEAFQVVVLWSHTSRDELSKPLKERALSLYREVSKTPGINQRLAQQIARAIGDCYLDLHDPKAACAQFEKVAREAAPDEFGERVHCEIQRSRCLRYLHEPRKAAACTANARRILNEALRVHAERPWFNFLYASLAQTLLEDGDYPNAASFFERAADAYGPSNRIEAGRGARCAADCLYMMQEYKEALVWYNRAASELLSVRGPGRSDELAVELNLLARSFRAHGQLQRADALYTRALSEYAKSPISYDAARCRIEQGECSLMRGAKMESVPQLEHAAADLLALKNSAQSPPSEQPGYYLSLAQGFDQAEKPAQALPWYRAALVVFEKSGKPQAALCRVGIRKCGEALGTVGAQYRSVLGK